MLPPPAELPKLVDNPIALRSVFAKLRFPGAWIGLIVVSVVCTLIVAGCFVIATWNPGAVRRNFLPESMTTGFSIILFVQCLILFIIGTSSIGTGIAADRDSAVYEMMRLIPRPSWQIMAGYVLGMPVREHLWVIVTAPFAALTVFFSTLAIERVLVLYAVVYASAVLFHLLAAACGVLMKRARRSAAGAAVAIVMMLYMVGWLAARELTIYPTLYWVYDPADAPRKWMGSASFFGVTIPVPVYSLIVMALVAALLWLAAVRKFRAEDSPALSPIESVGCALLFCAVLLGGLFGGMHGTGTGLLPMGSGAYEGVYVGVGFAIAMAFILAATPSEGVYAREVRRARKRGRALLVPLREGSLNPVACALIALPFGGTLAFLGSSPQVIFALAITSAASLLFFGALLQWCRLKFGRSWLGIFFACLFGFWGVPGGLTIITGLAEAPEAGVLLAGGLFPGVGLGWWFFATPTPAAQFVAILLAGINVMLAACFFAAAAREASRRWKAPAAPPLKPAATAA
jgi:hypothetical protein